ncbi:MAG: hypothetical protein DRJ21_00645 [Candidatus Methanomethylicota archaeon]|uniref:Brix domain-containing protein n=1 Tax=Thermoproteota archaeon TaxID=2056631 RepID=A0A497EUX3_9CREN|nr:MAG: hypothetical protein DRJ21_00645 [Candidatus Verstraetearchaeota archaeon]
MQRALPSAIKVNRGKMNLNDIALKALELGANRVLLISVFKGNPGRIRFFSVSHEEFIEIPPTINITGVKLVREFAKSKHITPKEIYLYCNEDYYDDYSEFLDKLSYALKAKIINENQLSNINRFSSILKIEHSRNNYCIMSFINGNGIPIGPLMRIKSVWLNIKSPFTSWRE